jgi:hypothetical protein
VAEEKQLTVVPTRQEASPASAGFFSCGQKAAYAIHICMIRNGSKEIPGVIADRRHAIKSIAGIAAGAAVKAGAAVLTRDTQLPTPLNADALPIPVRQGSQGHGRLEDGRLIRRPLPVPRRNSR